MLIRKMFRDLRQNAVQFFAIFLMTFFAMMIAEGFDSAFSGSGNTMDQYLQETNFKDLDVQGSVFTYEDIHALENLEAISSVDGVYQTSGKISLDQERKLLLNFVDANDISSLYVVDGETFQEGEDGVWMDARFCEARDIRPGDTVTIETENVYLQETVRGLVYSPEYIYYIPDASFVEPQYGEYGFAYLNIQEKPGNQVYFTDLLIDAKEVSGQVQISKKEQAAMDQLKNQIKTVLENENLTVLTKKQVDGYHYYMEQISSQEAIGIAFPILFFLISMLGILSTMTRLIARQRMQIGALKALGFSNQTIMVHYLLYGVVITFLGALTGTVVGYGLLGSFLSEDMVYFYCNPYEGLTVSAKPFVFILMMTVLAGMTAYFSNRKVLMETASSILRPEPPKKNGIGWLEHAKIWEKLRFVTKWNVRDVWRNRLRTAMSMFGVMICSMLLFSALSFYECLKYQPQWMYGGLVRAGYEIAFSDADYGTVYDYASEYRGQMVEKVSATIWNGDQERIGSIMVVDKGNCYWNQDSKGNYMQLPDEGAAITSKMAELLGLHLGDEVSFKISGEKEIHTMKITAINRNPVDQGLTFSRENWENRNLTFEPTDIYTNVTVEDAIVDRPEVAAVHKTEDLKNAMITTNKINYTTSVYMVVVAILLGIVVLYNLGMLSFVEKAREIATLKVLGFGTPTVRQILQEQNIGLTIVGMIPGIPLGFLFLQQMFPMLGDDLDFLVVISPVPYVCTILGIMTVSLLVNGYISSKIKYIDMVEALKGVE